MVHEFNASNEEDTCLWCGEPLKPNYTLGEVEIYSVQKFDPYGDEVKTQVKRRYLNKKFQGYGWENSGFFCTLRCGEAFGKAFARMGRRLEPKK